MIVAIPACRYQVLRKCLKLSRVSPSIRYIGTTHIRHDNKTPSLRRDKPSDEAISVFDELRREQPRALTPAQKVVENTQTTFYVFIMIGAAAGLLYILYTVASEFLFRVSPTSVFKMALKKIKSHERASGVLGDNIKGYGDTHSRTGKSLQFQPYEVAGTDYLRVVFHVSGSKRQGVCHVDMKKSARDGWKVRYVVVNLEGFPPGKITVEDNRHETDSEELPDIDYSEIDKEFKA